MKVILLLVTCVLLSSSHALTSAGVVNRTINVGHKKSLTFIATVQSVEPLGKRELSIIPVDFDPRFAVTVHIESVTSHDGPLQVGTDQGFAIHSPARLFRTGIEDVILKKYRFKVNWEKSADKARFSALTASVIEDTAP